MIVRCEKCGSALTYDIVTGKMKCEYCRSESRVKKIIYHSEETQKNTMECSIYTCTACGAELVISDVEAATYCAYCGQPAIVFDRISQMYQPDKIIPFKITREHAENLVRERFRKGFFIPKEIKCFQVEHMVGVYVPFWIYDITYSDDQEYTTSRMDCCSFYYREAEASFKNILVDASSHVHNELTHRLEPFYMAELKDFKQSYLSGFSADCYDQDAEMLRNTAGLKCKALFDEEVRKTIDTTYAELIQSRPVCKVDNQTYAMFPVWFLTLFYEKRPYTILVNGQTGKIVGTVPIKKWKVWFVFAVLFGILAPVFTKGFSYLYGNILYPMFTLGGNKLWQYLSYGICTAGIVISVFLLGRKSFRVFYRHMIQTSESKMMLFVKNRKRKGK